MSLPEHAPSESIWTGLSRPTGWALATGTDCCFSLHEWEETACCVQPKEKGLAHLFLCISPFHKLFFFFFFLKLWGGDGVWLPAWPSLEGQL